MKLKSILLKLLTLGATLMASGGTSPEIIVPLTIYNRPEVHIKDLLELHRRYGFCNFALVSPSMGWRSVGYPPQSAFVEGAEKFKTIREELAKHNIRCG